MQGARHTCMCIPSKRCPAYTLAWHSARTLPAHCIYSAYILCMLHVHCVYTACTLQVLRYRCAHWRLPEGVELRQVTSSPKPKSNPKPKPKPISKPSLSLTLALTLALT